MSDIKEMQVGIRTLRYRVVPHDPGKSGIAVDPSDWDQDPETAIRAQLTSSEVVPWCFLPEFRDREVLEHWEFRLGDRCVDIRTVHAPLSPVQVASMTRGLTRICSMVRDPARWTLRNVFIRADLPENRFKGRPMRGQACYPDGFALFPGVLEAPWSRFVSPDELELTIVHETAHIVVERSLRLQWHLACHWYETKLFPGYRVFGPNGQDMAYVCLKPENCPSPYAACHLCEDPPESTVTYAYGFGPLRGGREVLLRQILNPPDTSAMGTMVRCESIVVPDTDVLNVTVEDADFTVVSASDETPPVTDISYDDFIVAVRSGKIPMPGGITPP